MQVKATVSNGALHASWGQNDEADSWLVVIVRKKRTGQEVVTRLTLDAETLSFDTADIDLGRGPHGVRIFALRNRKPLARGVSHSREAPWTGSWIRPPRPLPKNLQQQQSARRSDARQLAPRARNLRQPARSRRKSTKPGKLPSPNPRSASTVPVGSRSVGVPAHGAELLRNGSAQAPAFEPRCAHPVRRAAPEQPSGEVARH